MLPEANADGLYVRGAIASDVREGVEGLDEAMVQFPKTVAAMMKSVGKHGIAALPTTTPPSRRRPTAWPDHWAKALAASCALWHAT